jgi:hypothetical protein
MKTRQRTYALICVLLVFTISCSFMSGLSGKESGVTENPGADSAQSVPGTKDGQKQPGTESESTLPAAGTTVYMAALPVEVTDATGMLKVSAARAIKGMKSLNIIVVLENTASDPLQIYQSVDWQAKVYGADGSVVGETQSSEEVGLPPGQKMVLRAQVDKWQGDAERIGLELVSAKPRFIQDDMQEKFSALKFQSPIFSVEAQPFVIKEGVFFASKVITADAQTVIKNPYPGEAKDIETRAVYYDAAGQIIGFGMGGLVTIPAGGQLEVKYIGMQYFAGLPVKAEYYAFLQDAFIIADLFKLW